MNTGLWRLPWRGRMVEHGVIDVVRGCNLSCRADHDTPQAMAPKPLDDIREELETPMRRRRMTSVGILGGEVTLPPHLFDVVCMVREHGLRAELTRNGRIIRGNCCPDRSLKNGLLIPVWVSDVVT